MNSTNSVESDAPSKRFRVLRVLIFCFVCLVTALALFRVEENIRGKRAWEKYKAELQTKGDWLELANLIPPPVPDDENFAMTPFFRPLYDYLPGTQTTRETNAQSKIYKSVELPDFSSQALPFMKKMDLAAVTAAFAKAEKRTSAARDQKEAALEILNSLRKFDPILQEIETASRRPYSRFNVNYECKNACDILLPHLGTIKRLCQILRLRASAELTVGRTEDAFRDVKLMFYLSDSIKNEPIMISHLVRIACVNLALQPVWEGMADHQWSEARLKALQAQCQGYDIVQTTTFCLQAERVFFGGSIFAMLRQDPATAMRILDSGWSGPHSGPGWRVALSDLKGSVVKLAIPSGWIYLEQLSYFRLFRETLYPPYDLRAHRINPTVAKEQEAKLYELLSDNLGRTVHHRVIAGMMLPALTKVATKGAQAQTSMDLAATACALERFRLTHGQLPEALADLVPQFLEQMPNDVITGQPLKYRPAENGQFLLYSVGWNETDDGGKVVMGKGSTPSVDINQGDWVWFSSPSQ